MAKSDVIVKMKADVSGYDANIAKARRTLEGFKQDNLSLGGILNQTTKSLASMAAGFLSVSVAAEAMKSVIDQSIELAKSGQGIEMAFERLNDPGLLDGLREATHGTVNDIELMKAAVKFNDFKLPLDQLGTMLAFAQKKAKDTGQSVDYMVDSIVTGLGRKSKLILDNLGISAAEIDEKMKETGDMTKAVGEIIREQMEGAGDYVETAAEKAKRAEVDLENAMTQLGKTLLPLQEQGVSLFSSMELSAIEFLNNALTPIVPKIIALKENIGGLYDTVVNNPISSGVWDWLETGLDVVSKLIPKIQFLRGLLSSNGGTAGDGAAVGNLGLPDNTISKTTLDEIVVTGKKRTKTTTPRSTQRTPQIGDFDKALGKSLLDTSKLKEGKEMLSPFAMMTEEAKKQMLGLADATEDLGSAQAELGNQKVIEMMDAMKLRTEQQKAAFDLAAQSAANLGSALASIDDPAAKAIGTVMSAIANIALSFSQAAIQASQLGPYGWIAYMAAGLGTLATAISTVHSLTGYATGGEIKGNSYSGDNIPIMANAGEIVLNKAQQATLASSIQQSGGGGSRVVGILKGEDIVLMADRWGMRTGRGELLFGKNL